MSRPLYILVAVIALTAIGCQATTELGKPFPLVWRGVDSSFVPVPDVTNALRPNRLKLQPFDDLRPGEKTKVGEYQADKSPVLTTTSVSDFCSNRFAMMMTQAGVVFVTTGETLELRPYLLEFNVVEAGLYNATVRVKFAIMSNGQTAWEGIYEGKSKRWGRSHNPDNYNESLSNALAEVTKRLVEDPAFGRGISAASAKAGP